MKPKSLELPAKTLKKSENFFKGSECFFFSHKSYVMGWKTVPISIVYGLTFLLTICRFITTAIYTHLNSKLHIFTLTVCAPLVENIRVHLKINPKKNPTILLSI